jgi:hypothetical protein
MPDADRASTKLVARKVDFALLGKVEGVDAKVLESF